jgi:hypothetical protein
MSLLRLSRRQVRPRPVGRQPFAAASKQGRRHRDADLLLIEVIVAGGGEALRDEYDMVWFPGDDLLASTHGRDHSPPWRDLVATTTPSPGILPGRSSGCEGPLDLRSLLAP